VPWILLTVSQPDITWSTRSEAGGQFGQCQLVSFSVREVPSWYQQRYQGNVWSDRVIQIHLCHYIVHELQHRGFSSRILTTCWIVIVSWQFLRVAYFSGSESTALILSGSSSKPETMTYCSVTSHAFTPPPSTSSSRTMGEFSASLLFRGPGCVFP